MGVIICMRGSAWRLYPCKLWTGSLVDGYGKVWRDRKYHLVHRLALAEKLGRPIRPGLQAQHHCDVRNCYEPEHLYEGTQTQNMQDAYDRSRRGHPGKFGPAERAAIQARVAGGMSQNALARELRVWPSTICRIVNQQPGKLST